MNENLSELNHELKTQTVVTAVAAVASRWNGVRAASRAACCRGVVDDYVSPAALLAVFLGRCSRLGLLTFLRTPAHDIAKGVHE